MKTLCFFLIFLTAAGGYAKDHALEVQNALGNLEHGFNGTFDDTFWQLSQKVAREQGVAIVEPILEKSKKWHGEEGLVYMPALALLPRAQTVALLKTVKDPKEKIWANEFLTEFDMADTKEAVRKYGGER